MKATGIVRRIDDLGRVVVPKEIRRTLRIREGDPLEIFTDHEGEIILKKYSPIGELTAFAQQYADALAQTSGHIVLISDNDQYVAAAGNAKDARQGGKQAAFSRTAWLLKPISKELEQAIHERESIAALKEDTAYIALGVEEEDIVWQVMAPIIAEGDAIGAVLLLGRDTSRTPSGTQVRFGEAEVKMAAAAALFLGKQMEG